MSVELVDFNRRGINFATDKVAAVLPEHFAQSYPNLITFLDKYYEFLDSDQTINFNQTIKTLLTSRDIQESSLQNLNMLLKEIGMGVIPTNYFRDPRYAARLLANFYRVKGSLYSAEGFFRAFYETDVEVIYPKRVLFTVGESLIGPNDGYIIQDGALYQIFSILIRSDISISTWGDLYRMFVHPAGFYLGSEVTFTSVASMMQNPMPVVLTGSGNIISFTSLSTPSTDVTVEYTGIGTIDSTTYRYSVDDPITPYATIPINTLNTMYQNNRSLFTTESHMFDEDSDVGGRSMDMSNTIETFDQLNYPR